MMSKYFTPGTIVNLFPHDSQYKEAEILEISDVHIELKITTGSKAGSVKVGDILFYPLNKVIMKLIKP